MTLSGGSITATPIPAGGYIDTSGSRPPVTLTDAQLAAGIRGASRGGGTAMTPAGGAPASGGGLTAAPLTSAPRGAIASVTGFGPAALVGIGLVVLYLARR